MTNQKLAASIGLLCLCLAVAAVVLHPYDGPDARDTEGRDRLVASLDRVLGPPGTLIVEDLLRRVIEDKLRADFDLSHGVCQIQVEGVVRLYRRVPESPGDSIWVRVQ